MEQTTNLQLDLPGYGDMADIEVLNENFRKIDTAIETGRTNQSEHENNRANPHNVTKAQIGLNNVDNTSDMEKPISRAQQQAIESAASNANNAATQIQNHISNHSNPHGVTANQVGFGSSPAPVAGAANVGDALEKLDDKAGVVAATHVTAREEWIFADQLQPEMDALPRYLTEDLTYHVTGRGEKLTIVLDNFCGPGSLQIIGDNDTGAAIIGRLDIRDCSVPVTVKDIKFNRAGLTAEDMLASVKDCPCALLEGCSFQGSGAGIGVAAWMSRVLLMDCSVYSCTKAVDARRASMVSVYNNSGSENRWETNDIGAMVWAGGIVTIGGSTPDTMGGSSHGFGGGTVIGKNGKILA